MIEVRIPEWDGDTWTKWCTEDAASAVKRAVEIHVRRLMGVRVEVRTPLGVEIWSVWSRVSLDSKARKESGPHVSHTK